MTEPLLSVRGLSVEYRMSDGRTFAGNRDVSFDLSKGEILGLIGESGSGKTTAAKAALRLLPKRTEVDGEIWFGGSNILSLTDKEFRQVRWSELALVPQNALSALDPAMRIGAQIMEPMVLRRVNKETAEAKSRELLKAVGLREDHFRAYPHQLSGGMRQRVCVAMALALDPSVLVADEPTTALDVLVESEILHLLRRFRDELGLGLIYITHDLGVASELCDRLAVMYDGRILEVAPTEVILNSPSHPYTMGLIRSYPRWDEVAPVSIPGAPPSPGVDLPGCPFAPRCPFAAAECEAAVPPLIGVGHSHGARCIFAPDADAMRKRARSEDLWRTKKTEENDYAGDL